MLSSVSTDVWASDETILKQNIADKMFAPTSTTNIEQPNDFEPVAYQANRALMTANAAKELNELQQRNHATTAYTTLGCVAQPLFPSFDAQRAVNCSRRQDRVWVCNRIKLDWLLSLLHWGIVQMWLWSTDRCK
ncbi:MAG: hypothetical protein K0U52_04595 [Gammaproteobacteria bacterium]|nr:hypothetical protein [Gammaproteobacteria bacterium]